MTRTEDFNDGAERVRQPEFKSIQQQHNTNFRAMSVLDTPSVIPNQNGIGAMDLQRKITGNRGHTTGASQSTYDRQIWLTNPETATRTDDRKKEE